MSAFGLTTGVCTGHGCWPPMGYAPSPVTNVQVTKLPPLVSTQIRNVHCKPCGKNPACHPGTVSVGCATVMCGVAAPSTPMPAPKTGDPDTDATLAKLAPKYCASRLPPAKIGTSISCGSKVAVGAPNVLLCSGGSAAKMAAIAAAIAALGAFPILSIPSIGGGGGPGSQSPGDNSVTDCD
tara:strand:- start:31767 stop:32309 length:543 start_codon:yes stop_codon:yes gene_type:complete